jgi:integrating conjugative element protein (TIGR03758 family)
MPLMSADQNAAFNTANSGVSFSAGETGVFVISVGIVLMLTWCAWVAISSYRALSNPGASVPDAAGKIVRAVFVVMMVIAVMAL